MVAIDQAIREYLEDVTVLGGVVKEEQGTLVVQGVNFQSPCNIEFMAITFRQCRLPAGPTYFFCSFENCILPRNRAGRFERCTFSNTPASLFAGTFRNCEGLTFKEENPLRRCVAVVMAGVLVVSVLAWTTQAIKLGTQAQLAERAARIEERLTASDRRMGVLSQAEPKMAELAQRLTGLKSSLKQLESGGLARSASALQSQVAHLERTVQTIPGRRSPKVIRFIWTNKGGSIKSCPDIGYQLDGTVTGMHEGPDYRWSQMPAVANELQRFGLGSAERLYTDGGGCAIIRLF